MVKFKPDAILDVFAARLLDIRPIDHKSPKEGKTVRSVRCIF